LQAFFVSWTYFGTHFDFRISKERFKRVKVKYTWTVHAELLTAALHFIRKCI
jgi:hypothetical protein